MVRRPMTINAIKENDNLISNTKVNLSEEIVKGSKKDTKQKLITWDSDTFDQIELCAHKLGMNSTTFIRWCVNKQLLKMEDIK